MKRTCIIDYSLGNLNSVSNAVEAVDGNPKIINQPELIKDASHLILPGVGTFSDGIKNLADNDWIEAIQEYINSGRPFLGICLGMQLLADKGSEHGMNQGLGLISGTVDRLQLNDESLRLPHIGWNDVLLNKKSCLSKGLSDKEDFYFIHGYAYKPKDKEVVSGVCDYGGEFVAMLEHENMFATQFHPEKSQRAGLILLENFLRID